MFGHLFTKQKAGKVISARTLNTAIEGAERANKIQLVAPLRGFSQPGGTLLAMDLPDQIDAQITSGSGSGPYSWTQQLPVAGGSWQPGFLTDNAGADPAYNTTGATPIMPLIVPMMRTTAGFWQFTAGTC